MESNVQPNFFVQLIPMIVIGLMFGFATMQIARRKGKKVWVNLVWCFVPVANMFWFIYLISLTDVQVIKDLEDLKQAVRELRQP